MSNEDDFEPKQPSDAATIDGSGDTAAMAADQPGEDQAGSSELICQAEDLKDLLQQIAHQISDADKRHGHALRAMQERLAAIGDRAEQVKTQVPEEFRPAFERIDEAVSLLGDRIALAERERHARQGSATQSAAPSQSSADGSDQAAEPATPAADDRAASIAAFAAERRTSWSGAANPNATGLDEIEASAAAAAPTPGAEEAATAQVEPQPAAQDDTAAAGDAGTGPETATDAAAEATDKATATAEPAPGAPHSIAADPTKPWDPQSAEALVALYAAGPEGLPPPPESDEAETAPDADTSADDKTPAEGESLQAGQVDQQWLEARFADVAARVEMSLADIKPDYSMDALGQRFDQLEEQIGSALQDALNKNDIAGLSLVEEHITDLTSHLDYAQTQLARLDGIEDNLGDIVGQLSAGAHGSPSGLMADAPDVTALAETVAYKVASTVLAGQPMDGSQEQFNDLREMLQGYMMERREGEKNTSGALDTMQAALIHLVERVDAIESNGTDPLAAPADGSELLGSGALGSGLGPAAAVSAAAHIASSPPGQPEPQEYVREAVRFKVNDGQQMPADQHYVDATQLDAAAAEARGMADMAAEVAATHQAPRGFMGGAATSDALPAAAAANATMGATASAAPSSESDLILSGSSLLQTPPSDDGKADFIAQARRAQQLAGERMEQEELERERVAQSNSLKSRLTSASDRRGASGRDQASANGVASDHAGAQGVKAKGKGLPRTLLVACAALAIVTMATLITGKLSGGPDSSPAIEKKMVPPQPDKAAAKTGNSTAKNSAVATPAALSDGAQTAPTRGVPETVTDNLSSGETEAPNNEVLDSSSLPQRPRVLGGGAGVGTGPNATAMLSDATGQHIQQEGGAVTLASRIAPPAGLQVDVTKAALHPQTAADTAFISTGSAALQEASNRALNMPPALIGPLSLRLAAAKGDPSAEFEVAARFAEGKGIMQDFSEAVRWYQRSAARGFAPAQYRLGTLFERGMGVKTDLPRARIWYLRAAKQGNVKAMHNLAVLSAGRIGAKPDYVTAAQWFTEAGERGLADSQFNLGILFETGLGVKRDLVGSYKWFSLAAARGDKQAENRRISLRGKLTPAQLTSAERKVRSWRQTPVEVLVNDPRAAGQAWLGHTNTGKAG